MSSWLSLPGADALIAALLLLPGLLALRIRDAMTETETRDYKNTIMSALLYVVVVYGIVALLALVEPWHLTPLPTDPRFNPWTFLAMFCVAVSVGFLAGLIDNKRWVQSAALALDLSDKTWRNAWVDAFKDAERKWVCVYLKDGSRVVGWVKYHSASAEQPTLYVARGPVQSHHAPALYIPAGTDEPTPIEGPGILLPPSAGITLVAFLDGEAQK